MTVQKPLKLFGSLLERQRSIGKVLTNLRVTIEREQRAQVRRFKMPQSQPGSFKDDHAATAYLTPSVPGSVADVALCLKDFVFETELRRMNQDQHRHL